MLYLFLTGRRAAYLNDIFTVLNLPPNSIYDLKYKISNNNIVDSSTNEQNCKAGKKVLISYIDLEEAYIPLRWAYLQGISEEEGQRYYSVKLTEYCHIAPQQQYGNFLQGISNGGLRHICADGQTIEGFLAFVHSDEPENIVVQGKDSWAITVRQLGELDLFKKNYSIFTKFEIKDSKEEPKENNDITGCILKSKHNYKVHITYYIPEFNAKPMSEVFIQFYETDKRLGLVNKQNLLLSEQNIIDIPCFPDTGGTGEKVKVALQLNVLEKQMYGKSVRYAMAPVEMEIQDTLSKRWRIGLTVACVAGIFLASLINSFDFSKVLEITNAANCQNKLDKIILEFLKAKSFWSSTIATVATWGMVKLVGRAKL